MAAAAIPLAIASSVMGGVSSIMQGKAQATQYADQAQLAQRQAQDVDLQSTEMSASARSDLGAGMSTIMARRSAANVGLDSPTAQAIESNYKKISQGNENIQAVGYGNQQYALLSKAAMDQQQGKSALLAGYLGGAQKFFSGFSSMAGGFGGSGSGFDAGSSAGSSFGSEGAAAFG